MIAICADLFSCAEYAGRFLRALPVGEMPQMRDSAADYQDKQQLLGSRVVMAGTGTSPLYLIFVTMTAALM